jgi:hypothetical protein
VLFDLVIRRVYVEALAACDGGKSGCMKIGKNQSDLRLVDDIFKKGELKIDSSYVQFRV